MPNCAVKFISNWSAVPGLDYNEPTNRLGSVTRNSSGDEIANVNFLYDDIVHVGLL